MGHDEGFRRLLTGKRAIAGPPDVEAWCDEVVCRDMADAHRQAVGGVAAASTWPRESNRGP